MDEEIFASVKAFTLEQARVSEKKLHADARLEENLGIDGDDADEFMEAFAEKFDVDMTNFKVYDYFDPEGPFVIFYELYLWLFKGQKPKKLKQITLRDLVKAVEAKKWIPPIE